MGVPPNLKLGVSVTQTSVVEVVADQSTHASSKHGQWKRLNKTLLLAIYIFDLCFPNPNVYISKTEWYLNLYIAHCIYIFKRKNIADFFQNECIYPGLKYETLNFDLRLRLYFWSRLFLHNWCVLNSNLSDIITYLVSFTFKSAKQKPHLFYIFVTNYCTISGFCMILS